jgi:hypothetical protein
MKQMEIAKREYIEKLKKELDVVEEKWQQISMQNAMVGEDYRSQGVKLMEAIAALTQTVEEKDMVIEEANQRATNLEYDILALKQVNENSCMAFED